MIRRLALLALVLALSACGRKEDLAPFTDTRLAPGAPPSAWAPAGWAWGLLKLKDRPALRYGVSAPAAASEGQVVILPGYGESAEMWFETAGDLNREGYTVWVLEGAGQGGSGRFTGPRDLGHVPDFETDIQGVKAFVAAVIRPKPDSAVSLIASGTAALPALAAAERGLPVKLLILSAPAELEDAGGAQAVAAKAGVKTLRASGGTGWMRPPSTEPVPARRKIALGWAVANPDLRMGGPSGGWLVARKALVNSATTPEGLARVTAPVLIFTSKPAAPVACTGLPRCRTETIPARFPYHQEENGARTVWLKALIAELSADHAT